MTTAGHARVLLADRTVTVCYFERICISSECTFLLLTVIAFLIVVNLKNDSEFSAVPYFSLY